MAIRQPYVDVTLGNTKKQTYNGLYQYDHGVKIRIHDLSSDASKTRVQFSYDG